MKIEASPHQITTTKSTQASIEKSDNSPSFSSVLTEATASKKIDFTSMTRKEMFDWMNENIRSGKMSLDESSPFLAMTMKISADGQLADMSIDSTRVNFVEKARLGIEGALLNKNPDLAMRLQMAIELMLRQHN